MRNITHPYTRFNAVLRKAHLLRHLPRQHVYRYDFSSNDYLGLSQHPLLIGAAIKAADNDGVGSKASRLVSSKQAQIQALEYDIAKQKHTQSALVFSTGFQANVSVISALLDSKTHNNTPLVFSDRLNHASMHVGCQLAKAKQLRFHHLDYDHLHYLLKQSATSHQPKFILTESVFGMDGDVADLEQIIRLAKQFTAFVYVDEAHASGLFGKTGFGLTSDYGKEIDLSMGTFSKALGSSGAYIACNKALKRYLINKSQGFVFSTAPSPVQIAVMQAAWDLIPQLRADVTVLLGRAKTLRQALQEMGYDTGNSSTHIIPIILKDPAKTLTAQQLLSDKECRVSAIRAPSVPPQQDRLRIALSTAHTQGAIDALVTELAKVKLVLKLP